MILIQDVEMTLGERIRQFREAASLTQQELAEKVGIGFQNVSRWERNKSVPSWLYIQRLADALGVSTEAFREGVEVEAVEEPPPTKKPSKK